MSLRHALLTSLMEKPCTGAELARRFEKSIGHFWQASHQQIYRELAALEADGLIEVRGLATARGSQRHFAVLAGGRNELERWCLLSADPHPVREALLVRLRAAAVLGTVDLASEVRRHLGLHQDSLRRYQAIQGRDFAEGSPLTPAGELQLAVLRAGIEFERAWLAWCQQTLCEGLSEKK
ncbi:PadR family transcriptional regulator [Arthrobacter cryoconiti]|uniref:PadR family transcriptional regulator n=1 Tax=Arthrobacter cryoconiti TaxID=748907 RepID=A0ABV8R2E3_9MICC|nr:PadR family transcriptional regulator [Arthrobacter cryoconiti]